MGKHALVTFIFLLVLLLPPGCDRGKSRRFGDSFGVVAGQPVIKAVVNIGDYPGEFPGVDFANVPIERLAVTMSGKLLVPPAYKAPTLVPGQFCYVFGDNFGQKPAVWFGGSKSHSPAYYGNLDFGVVLAVVPRSIDGGTHNIAITNGRGGYASAKINITRLGVLLLDGGATLQRFDLADGQLYGDAIPLPVPAAAAGICMSRLSDFILMSDTGQRSIMAMPVERLPLEVAGGIGYTPDFLSDPFILSFTDLPGGALAPVDITPAALAQAGSTTACAALFGGGLGIINVSPLEEIAFSYRSTGMLSPDRYPVEVFSFPPAAVKYLSCSPDGKFAVVSAGGGGHVIVPLVDESAIPIVTDYGAGFFDPGPVAFGVDGPTGASTLLAAFAADGPGGNEGRIIALDFEAFIESGLGAANLRTAAVGPGAFSIAVTADGKTAFAACNGDGTLVALDVGTLAVLGALPLPGGAGTIELVADPDSAGIFALNRDAGRLIFVDAADPAAMTAIEVRTGLSGAAGIVAQRPPFR